MENKKLSNRLSDFFKKNKKQIFLWAAILVLVGIGVFFLIKLSPWQDQKRTVAESYYEQGLGLEEEHRFSEALQKYTKATEADPNYYKAYIQISRIYQAKGKIDEALSVLDEAKEVNTGKESIYLEISSIYYTDAKYNDALKHIKNSLGTKQTSSAQLLMAKILFHLDKTDDAGKYLNKIGKDSDEYQEAVLLKTLLAEGSKEINDNLKLITSKGLRKYKDDLGYLADAIDQAEGDDDKQAFVDTVRSYNMIKTGYPEAAISFLKTISESHPEYFDAVQYLGIAYEQVDKNDQAKETMLNALSLNPTRAIVYQVLAKVAFKEDNVTDFTKNYETSIAYAENDVAQELRMEYADRLMAKKLYTTAQKIYQNLLKKNPKDSYDKEIVYRVALTKMLVGKSKQYESAIEESGEYISSDAFKNLKNQEEEKASLLAYLCGAKIKLGDRVEGNSLCDQAIKEYSYSAVAYYYKGLSEYDLNEKTEAEKNLKKAIDYDLSGEVANDASKLLKSL